MLIAEAEWRVQGVHGINPLKVKKKIKTTSKSSDATHLSTVKVNKKPDFVKNCVKNINLAVVGIVPNLFPFDLISVGLFFLLVKV